MDAPEKRQIGDCDPDVVRVDRQDTKVDAGGVREVGELNGERCTALVARTKRFGKLFEVRTDLLKVKEDVGTVEWKGGTPVTFVLSCPVGVFPVQRTPSEGKETSSNSRHHRPRVEVDLRPTALSVDAMVPTQLAPAQMREDLVDELDRQVEEADSVFARSMRGRDVAHVVGSSVGRVAFSATR